MVKVLISTCFGINCFTPKMREIMQKKEGIRRRIGEVVDYVEKVAVVCKDRDDTRNIMDILKDKEAILTFEGKSGRSKVYYFRCSDKESVLNGSIVQFSIIEVDETMDWTIEEYDGSESIRYLDSRKLVDEELHYWEML